MNVNNRVCAQIGEILKAMKRERYESVLPPMRKRMERLKRLRSDINAMYYDSMLDCPVAVCADLSQEQFVLPPVVNIVYSVDFGSPCITGNLDLLRIANQLPNSKYKPNFPSIAIKMHPTTATLFGKLNVELVKTTTPGMALFFSHVYRQLLERLSLILHDEDTGRTFVGTLEGYLGMSVGIIHNVVGNGVLPQDGVHLMNLLNATEDKSDHDPENFPNLIHTDKLSNGRSFTANIANTAKVVLMGLKCVEDMHEAYKIICDRVHNFDDPNVPTDPHERWKYRRRQLQQDPAFKPTTDDGWEGMGDADDDDADDYVKPQLPNVVQHMKPMLGAILNVPEMPTIVKAEDGEEEEEPLLYMAAKAGQIQNVITLLNDEDEACPYPDTDPDNERLVRQLQEIPDTETRTYALIINHIREWRRRQND